ncbi:MAG: TonB-dependent receptor [Steroidobacteraceae bacterium]
MEAIRALYLAGIALAGTAQAETRPSTLEEVVVTARRIEERLADVPLSVTVIDGLQLDDFAVTRWEDLTLPGIKIGPGGLLDVMSIRGIASGLNFGFEQSAPVFIDGVWFGSSRSSRSGFVDVERIEILKGPQPTHFGKNAIAGAFGIVTRKPQPEFAASVDAYYEFEHDETAITGVVNVPLSETLAARVAAKWRDLDGYMTNPASGRRTPQQRDELGRLALRWQPADELILDGKVEYSKNTTRGLATQYVRCVPQAFTTPRLLNPAYENCRLDDVRAFRYDRTAFGAALGIFDNPDRPGELQDHDLLSGLVSGTWTLPDQVELSFDVAYYDQHFYAEVKQDHSWNQRALAAYEDSSRLFSQPARLRSLQDGRWSWMLGAYHEQGARDNAPFAQVALQAPANQAIVTNTLQDSDSWSVFGDAAVRVLDELTLRLAARYTAASRDFEGDRTVYQLSPNSTAPGVDRWSFAVPVTRTRTSFLATRQSSSDDKLTPAATLEWRPADGQLYYVSWREGFKAGGFNAFLTGPIDQIEFDPETVDYLEAGLKLTLAGGAVRLDVAVFDGDYSDLQVSLVDPVSGQSSVRNAASAESRGVDFAFDWAFREGWQLGLTLAWLDASYGSFANQACYVTPLQTIAQGCVRIGGAPLPPSSTLCPGNPGVTCAQDLSGLATSFAPEWSGTTSLEYRRALAREWLGLPLALRARVDWMFTDEFYTTVNGAPGSKQPSYAKLDARLALGSADGRWEVALVGRNLTDELYGVWYEPLVGAGPNTGYFATTARTRQLGLQLNVNY